MISLDVPDIIESYKTKKVRTKVRKKNVRLQEDMLRKETSVGRTNQFRVL